VSLIEWKESYAIGQADVDHEHQSIIALINELYRELERGGSVEDFLGEIYARISGHFALEEKLMREAGYPDHGPHKADHERLLDEIRDLMDAYEAGTTLDIARFGQALGKWFSVHFKEMDARLHARLGRGAGAVDGGLA
jgi:hemerythrin-like metal-binding protein